MALTQVTAASTVVARALPITAVQTAYLFDVSKIRILVSFLWWLLEPPLFNKYRVAVDFFFLNMTILDKVTLQQQDTTKIFLFKEGIFYKAYNEGAFLLKDKNYKVAVKKIKSIENEVLSIGFPVSVFEKLKDEFVFDFFEWYAVYNTNTFFDKELYINWHNKVVKESFKTSKTETEYIVEQLKKYPLANKTPMEVFMWVANLQKTLSN